MMNNGARFWLGILIAGLAALVAAAVSAAPQRPGLIGRSPTGAECDGANLLTNPSFEGQYSAYIPPNGHPDCPAGICTTAQMAPGWTPYWRSHDPADPPWIIRMPEYKPADPIFTDPVRVRSGDAAQQYFTFYSTHEAGFYQQVTAVPGGEYCFSIWGHSWSADDSDDAYSGPVDGQLFQKIGIDPTGGTDWQSPNIAWGAPRIQYDYYGLFSLMTTAQAEAITVFVYSQPLWAVKHNDVYWDDSALTLQSPPASLNATTQLTFLADVNAPGVQSQPLQIDLTGPDSLSWTATVAVTGTLPAANLSLNPASGGPGDDALLTFDSAGLAVGTYTTTVTITTSEPVDGSPWTIPVTAVVAPELTRTYLPGVRWP